MSSSERVVSSNNMQIKNGLWLKKPYEIARLRAIRPIQFWIGGESSRAQQQVEYVFYKCSTGTRKQFFYDKRYLSAKVYELYRQFTKILNAFGSPKSIMVCFLKNNSIYLHFWSWLDPCKRHWFIHNGLQYILVHYFVCLFGYSCLFHSILFWKILTTGWPVFVRLNLIVVSKCKILSFSLPSSRSRNDSKFSRGTKTNDFIRHSRLPGPDTVIERVSKNSCFLLRTATIRTTTLPENALYVQQRGNKTKTLIFRLTYNAHFKRRIANIINRGVRNKSYFAFGLHTVLARPFWQIYFQAKPVFSRLYGYEVKFFSWIYFFSKHVRRLLQYTRIRHAPLTLSLALTLSFAVNWLIGNPQSVRDHVEFGSTSFTEVCFPAGVGTKINKNVHLRQ